MRLVEKANERGGRDNITALVLSVRALDAYVAESDDASAPEPARKSEKRVWGLRR